MEPYVDSVIEAMSSRLAAFSNISLPVNMAFWMQAYAFDVVGELAFGQSFGFVSSGQDVSGQMANLRRWLKSRFTVGMIPWFFPVLMSPIAAFFSSASKQEQVDQKKRNQVATTR
jgi:Cytochrome P450